MGKETLDLKKEAQEALFSHYLKCALWFPLNTM